MQYNILVLSLILIISAQSIHQHNSERNFICSLCKKTVEIIQEKDEKVFNKITKQFPKIQEYLQFPQEISLSAEEHCTLIELCGSLLESEELVDLQKIAQEVNSQKRSWTAEIPSRFSKISLQEIKMMMGTVVDPDWTVLGIPKQNSNESISLPDTFDARVQWPECASIIGHIRDQSNCGSCWAFGTTEAYNDRLCIATKGEFSTLLSVADTTACCTFNNCMSNGCNGGQINFPWAWFVQTGVVTGGDYNDTLTCFPYTMPQCNHHISNPEYQDCSQVKQDEPKCYKQCYNKKTYMLDKKKALTSYWLNTIDQIKGDIYSYGSATAAFTVYEDFLTYKSGVYRHVTGKSLGGHAIKIIGWGVDHWICVNSWNDQWGDQGTFRIAFRECGIDSQVMAGKA